MRALTLAVLLVTTGCGGSSKSAEEPELEDVDSDEAAGEARDVIGEVHAAIKRGTPEGLLPILAEDLFVAAPDGTIFPERSAAVVALTDLFGGKKHKLKSRGLKVVSGPGGHAAWATEEVDVDGVTYVVTAVLEDVDDIWVVSAVHLARPVADKKVEQAVEAGKMPSPPELTGGVEPEAKPVVDLFLAATEAEEVRAEQMAQLADRKDVMLLGSAPKESTRGAKKIKKLWNKALKKKPTLEPQGEVRAAATGDGALVWLIVNVDLGSKGAPPIPHRAFYVYERAEEAEGGWALVAAHEAVIHF
jgi:ketosteroid isomerase-like protein